MTLIKNKYFQKASFLLSPMSLIICCYKHKVGNALLRLYGICPYRRPVDIHNIDLISRSWFFRSKVSTSWWAIYKICHGVKSQNLFKNYISIKCSYQIFNRNILYCYKIILCSSFIAITLRKKPIINISVDICINH